MKNKIVLGLMFALIVAFSCTPVLAYFTGVPGGFNVQGVLTDGSGKPITATSTVTFRLYIDGDQNGGGTLLWEKNYTVTPASNGFFNQTLGGIDKNGKSLPKFEYGYMYMEIQIAGAATPLTPRQIIASVPYALSSRNLVGDINAQGRVDLYNDNTVATFESKLGIGVKAISNTGYGIYSSAPKNYFSGNVGIGTTAPPISKLEVNGDVRLVGTAAPAPVEGKIYFDQTSKRLNYCDGTKWIEIDPVYSPNEVKAYILNCTEVNPSAKTWPAFTPLTKDIIITSISMSINNTGAYASAIEARLLVAGVQKSYMRFITNNGTNQANWEQTFPIPIKVSSGQAISYMVNGVDYNYNHYIKEIVTHYMELPL